MQTATVPIPPLTAGDTLQLNLVVQAPAPPPPVVTPLIAGDRGADISRWNTITDWPALARDIKFLFVRSTMGAAGYDTKYAEYWSAAKRAGVARVGCYHLFIKDDDPKAQFANLLRVTGGDFGNLPIVLDVELRTAINETVPEAMRPTVQARLAALIAECERHTGELPMVYTSRLMGQLMLGRNVDPSITRCPLVVADYSGPVDMPYGWPIWAIHQKGVMRPAWATGDIDDDVCSGAPF